MVRQSSRWSAAFSACLVGASISIALARRATAASTGTTPPPTTMSSAWAQLKDVAMASFGALNWAAAMLLASSPAAAAANEGPATANPSPLFVYAVIAFVLAGTLIAFAATKAALEKTKWSLADALSEEAEVTFSENVNGVLTPKFDDNMKPVMVTELCASSSRLIAFIGLIAIMMIFMGFGVFVLYFFAMGEGVPPGLDQIYKFLLAGMTMFAPYVVNKFSSVFDWIKPSKTS
jgi:hypothetical protein